MSVIACIFVSLILPRLKTGAGAALSLALVVFFFGGRALHHTPEADLGIILPILILVVGYLIVFAFRTPFSSWNIRALSRISIISKKPVAQGEHLDSAVGLVPDRNRDLPVKDIFPLTIYKYRVCEEIGRESVWRVFIGEDLNTQRKVLIKTTGLSEPGKENLNDMRSRFFDEIKDCGLLTHPNIAHVEGYGEEDGLIYTINEYFEGCCLSNYITKGVSLPIRDALDVIAHASHALDFAHKKNIIHKHIMPDNIIITQGDKVTKITNFGSAAVSACLMTDHGKIPEHSYYMSPEQIAGKKLDGRSDIFSLGVILYEMLTGVRPFEGEDLATLMLKISRERPLPPKSINPKIPGVIEKVIYKALEKDREKRYQGAGQMAGHLDMIVARMDEIIAIKKK